MNYALLSVTDKTNLEKIAAHLMSQGLRLISSGGTASYLKDHGIEVTPVEQITGEAEMFSGRVKTLHPKIHGGLLFDRQNPAHTQQKDTYNIPTISVVVANLYDFAGEAVAKNLPLEQAIEHVDIGGPTMIRAAAKNFASVLIVTDPADYDQVIERTQDQPTGDLDLRLGFAQKAFALTAAYEDMISRYFCATRGALRYGENPQQPAYFKGGPGAYPIDKLHGKELSYNNYLDLDAAVKLAYEFGQSPAAVIIKHTNPCGCALGATIEDAYDKALGGDPVSAFGGIVALTREVSAELATKLHEMFLECVVAPSFSEEALKLLTQKKNLRLLTLADLAGANAQTDEWRQRSALGGTLIQREDPICDDSAWEVQGSAQLGEATRRDLLFAMKVAKHVKSNALVFAKDEATVAVGAGQTSRVDSCYAAIAKAERLGADLKGCVLASDGFFPFRDSIDMLKPLGLAGVVQPGGSIRDQEVLEAASEANLPMVFSHKRHFRH